MNHVTGRDKGGYVGGVSPLECDNVSSQYCVECNSQSFCVKEMGHNDLDSQLHDRIPLKRDH